MTDAHSQGFTLEPKPVIGLAIILFAGDPLCYGVTVGVLNALGTNWSVGQPG
jgi:hypothetical protein